MLEVLKTVLPSPEQWQIIIEGMRNPMNSWERSDSYKTHIENPETGNTADFQFFLGDADHALMLSLANGGPVHGKCLRMIPVWLTINAPLYWWKEFDTYKVGTVCNSCSTMHKMHSRPLTMRDFSTEWLEPESRDVFQCVVQSLNTLREFYCDAGNKGDWYQMIQLLPSSYNQRRTVMLNYGVLRNIYHSRKNHKLTEWHTFCDWIRQLPYSDLITG